VSNGFGFGFARATREYFSPRSLFVAGEVGAWYDPSDLSTLYQDSAGTTPVTAVEQPVGLMLDKSQGLDSGSSELVTNGDFSDPVTTGWTPTGGALSVVDGQLRLTSSTSPAFAGYSFTTVVGKTYRISGDWSSNAGTWRIIVGTTSGGSNLYAPSGAVSGTAGAVFTATATTTYVSVRSVVITAGNFVEIDNISVRELPGNHAFQSTSASRPTLSARVNLLTKTEDFSDAAWTKSNATVTANAATAPDGTLTADKFIPNAGISGATCVQTISVSVTAYTFSFYAKAAEEILVSLVSNLTGTYRANIFNTSSGAVTPGTGWTASMTAVGNGWWLCTATATADTAASKAFQISNNDTGWTGDGSSGIYIWGADLRVANDGVGIPEYQRVNTSTDYDTEGFPPYLAFDGSDDYMVTNTITPATAANTGRAALVTAGWTITDGGAV